jgi:(S)-ureidoglycine aminohydrolase
MQLNITPKTGLMKYSYMLAGILLSICVSAQSRFLPDTISPKVFELAKSIKTPDPHSKIVFTGSSAVLIWQQMNISSLKPNASAKKSHEIVNRKERFLIVKKGPLVFEMNGQVKTMDRGSVVLVLPGDELSITNRGAETAEYYEMAYESKQSPDMERGKTAGPSFMMDWKDMVFKPHDKGGVRQLFDRKTAMFNRFDIHVTQLNEGNKSHDPHQHKNEEIILMLEGNAEMQIGTDHQKANPGDVVFLTSNVLHNLSNIGKGACLYFAIQWN